MSNTSTTHSSSKRDWRAFALAALLPVVAVLALSTAPRAWADPTDLANVPLATNTAGSGAKPNLLFVLDSSGSMNWSYMPDDLGTSLNTPDVPYSTWYGYWSPQCNGVAYDPTATYTPPLNADGTTLYPNASFAAAWKDGYTTGNGTTNLNNRYYYKYTGTQPVMGWTYTSAGVITTSTFYKECSSVIGNTPGSNVFTVVTMTAASPDAQNYANWYSYYSHRYLLMRTAMGRAIAQLDSNFRVGFSTIYDTQAIDGTNNFRDVKDFDATQKTNFYSSLYSVAPGGSTTLPFALAEAGRYYGKRISGQTYDPIEYACQRNYTLMSTDGYWNSNGSKQLDGTTAIGQQDGLEDRPMRDNGDVTVTTVTTYSGTATRTQTSSQQSSTLSWTRTATTVSSTKVGGSGTNRNSYLITVTPQTYTETRTQKFATPQSSTVSYTHTVAVLNGTSTTTTDSTPAYAGWNNSGAAVTTATDTGAPTAGSSFTSGTSTANTYSATQGSGTPTYSTPSAGSWGAWLPASVTYTYSTPVNGAYTAGTPVVTTTGSGGSPNTLADVAEYYYKTDLRTTNCTSTTSGSSQNVCDNIVKPITGDPATWQHMNTFTIGLGASGTLPYDKNYLTNTSDPTTSYQKLTAGTINWPTPNPNGDATNIDDLWHTAVNGRGQYYSALNATLLAEAINSVVTAVQQQPGSGSAASTSALELVAGDNNQVYKASYETGLWTGDLQAYTLDGNTGAIGTTAVWSAQTTLDATTPATRAIWFSNGTTLQAFTYANLTTAGDSAYFSNLCSQSAIPSQCAGLNTADKALANNGSNLVDYLRGVQTYESAVPSTTSKQLYRTRAHKLGDIIDGAPVYVAKPPFSYADNGYSDFVTAQATRRPMIYAAANDGMLHAFAAARADNGTELWAFVPTAVLPNLYKLANVGYPSAHQYYVDGAPVMGDIKAGTTWKTIVVGGFNAGGQGYYALDITNPATPKLLWEFTDTNMGDSFGNPIITKRADGTWVVVFSSGYNNTGGDGAGHLFVLNANTGTKLLDISTGVGSAASPSGLSKINAWIDDVTNNTSLRYYGGDLLGNLWRFDVDNLVAPHQGAQNLATFQINTTTPQPITTKPQTLLISNKPVVIVGTGEYLGTSDIANTVQQSIYAIKDTLTNSGWGSVRADTTDFVTQVFTLAGTGASATASVSDTAVDWGSKGGWYVDLPHSGERSITDIGLQFNTLAIGTAIPNGDACVSGGQSWRYYLDVANGGVVTTNPAGVLWNANALIVGESWVRDSNGNVHIIYQNSDGSTQSEIPPTVGSTGPTGAHRTSWRELTN